MLAIHAVPAFRDNYLWVLERDGAAAVVDPGDAAPIEAFLRRRGLALRAILATHHHADHVGGLRDLARRWKCPAYGPAGEAIEGLDVRLAEGGRVDVPGLGVAFDVLDVPGHTAGHIAYVGEGAVFCGDTLFAGGCGRLFEGTPAQMWRSLGKLAALPEATRAYCAHEYTVSNLRFARVVEPDNRALAEREAREQARRAAGEATVPTTIGLELATNPFLRCGTPAVAESAARHAGRALAGPVEVFAEIRRWKDTF